MTKSFLQSLTLLLLYFGAIFQSQAQIDPEARHLIQFGYNQPMEGRGPLSGYAFYYWNQPNFHASNVVLRLAVAPVYLDSSVGITDALVTHTAVAFGLASARYAA